MSCEFLSRSVLAMILMLQILNELLTILQSSMSHAVIGNLLCELYREGFESEEVILGILK